MNAPNASGWRPEMGEAGAILPATVSGDHGLNLEEKLIFELAAPGTYGVDFDDADVAPAPALGKFLRKAAPAASDAAAAAADMGMKFYPLMALGRIVSPGPLVIALVVIVHTPAPSSSNNQSCAGKGQAV